MKEIYLDNSATTAVSDAALEKFTAVARDFYGNPSSRHTKGLEAEKIMNGAREQILAALLRKRRGAGQIIFTSGGTEANNLALIGCANAKKRRGKILISDGEHSSVEAAARYLESEGFGLVRIPTRGGVLDIDAVSENARDVVIASFMLVNNETGALYNIKEAFERVKALSPSAVTHCDAVQGFLKVRFSPESLGAELVSMSAHKIHAPKGSGALYVSPEIIKAKKLVPIIYGGGQESGLRSGTENVAGIAAFGEATRLISENFESENAKISSLRDFLLSELTEKAVPLGVSPVNPQNHAPHILSLTLPRIKSETMLHYLSGFGIYVSSGSACSSHSQNVSRAYTAFGLDSLAADCTLRVSLCPSNTQDEISFFTEKLCCGINTLVTMR